MIVETGESILQKEYLWQKFVKERKKKKQKEREVLSFFPKKPLKRVR